MTSYPPEPWDLHGHSTIGVWLLPRDRAPAPHSSRTRPVTVFGRCVVAVAFFGYEAPSPLTYGEVMSTVLVREGWRLRVSITHIWVDSPASMAGGRALWAIPKELAGFEIEPGRRYAAEDIGSVQVRSSRRLPFAVPIRFRIAQDDSGRLKVSGVRGTARLALLRARWRFVPDGPLGFLDAGPPLLSIACRPFHLVFGAR